MFTQPWPSLAPHILRSYQQLPQMGWRFLRGVRSWNLQCVHVFGSNQMGRSCDILGCYGPLFWLGYVQTWSTKNTDLWCNHFFISFSILLILDSSRTLSLSMMFFKGCISKIMCFRCEQLCLRDATNSYCNLYMFVIIRLTIYSSIWMIWYQIQFEYLISFFAHLLPCVS